MYYQLLGDDVPSRSKNHVWCAHMLNDQLTLLSACLADEVMRGIRIEQNDNRVSIQGKCACEDALTLGDILDGCVVHTSSSCSDDLCWTPR
jgi:hypothetical protein